MYSPPRIVTIHKILSVRETCLKRGKCMKCAWIFTSWQCKAPIVIGDSLSGVSDTRKRAGDSEVLCAAVSKLNPDRFRIEELVTPELDQRIDVFDSKTGFAYEFKVSGKHESAWAPSTSDPRSFAISPDGPPQFDRLARH